MIDIVNCKLDVFVFFCVCVSLFTHTRPIPAVLFHVSRKHGRLSLSRPRIFLLQVVVSEFSSFLLLGDAACAPLF